MSHEPSLDDIMMAQPNRDRRTPCQRDGHNYKIAKVSSDIKNILWANVFCAKCGDTELLKWK